jgi:nitroreductase
MAQDGTTAAALAEAADAARLAPSVHNTQPWRWRVQGESLDLLADRGRALPVADPNGRLLTMSCGAALHHARVALAAEGCQVDVARLPDPADPDHLARLTVAGQIPVTTEAIRLFQTMRVRHTDRRPVSYTPVPPDTIDAMRQAAQAEGVHLHLVRPDQVATLASAVAHADAIGMADPAQRAETQAWIGGTDERTTGIPDSAIPSRAPHSPVPGRDFGHPGSLDPGTGEDRAASYAILFGAGDRPVDWLRAGEALSAAWLAATEHGAAVVPITSAVEIGGTREVLRRILAGLGLPYAALRIGVPDPDRPGPPHTGRLSADDVGLAPSP